MNVLKACNVRNISPGKWRLLPLLVLSLFFNSIAFSQAKTLQGTVSDSLGLPLSRVSVSVNNTSRTTTDSKGNYSVNASKGDRLGFSFSGYGDQRVVVGESNTINVTLQLTSQTIDAVVVVGYGTQKKVNLSGAVAVVSGKEISNRPVANVTGALQGVLPGVTVLRGSGKPGAEGYGIRIRGFGTTESPLNTLVLVDGIEQDINLLDPADIESISVLKDASASAIYGARAAGGVILVTTKQGKAGKTAINFNTYYGVNITARQPERLDSWDEQILIDEARFNATGAKEFNDEQMEWLRNPNFSYRPN
ncbi:MAG: TonB-dependent receptor, partial [Sphingobacteriales bacterium]